MDGLDLEVRPGECFGLLGPNGAGKTTTIEICEGLTPPDAGEVLILGRRWGRDDRTPRAPLGISLHEPTVIGAAGDELRARRACFPLALGRREG